MPNIYDQHRKAFASVAAYVAMHGEDKVATIAFRFPKDGAGRLWAYVHFHGYPMVRGYASGYGYDKRSAALASATRNIMLDKNATPEQREVFNSDEALKAFYQALEKDDGHGWDRNLRNAGFKVYQAV